MASERISGSSIPRRDFIKQSAVVVGALGAGGASAEAAGAAEMEMTTGKLTSAKPSGGKYNATYTGERLNRIAFPMGGIGAGMICLEGTGALSHVSLRNRPEVFNEPCLFAAISIKGKPGAARILESPVPARKIFGPPGTGNGAGGTTYGLPRFGSATFQTHFPFGTVKLTDPAIPLQVELIGWSPFVPSD